MPPNGPQSEIAFEIKFAVFQFCNLLFMLICLHLQGQRNWQHWTWDPGRKSNTKIQEMKPGLNHIKCTKVGLFIKQGKSGLNVWESILTVKMTDRSHSHTRRKHFCAATCKWVSFPNLHPETPGWLQNPRPHPCESGTRSWTEWATGRWQCLSTQSWNPGKSSGHYRGAIWPLNFPFSPLFLFFFSSWRSWCIRIDHGMTT